MTYTVCARCGWATQVDIDEHGDVTEFVWAVVSGGFEVEIAGVWQDEEAAHVECLRRNKKLFLQANGPRWTVERWQIYKKTDVVGDSNVFEGGNP